MCTHACVCVFVCVVHALSCVQLFVTPWTVACQVPLSMELLHARMLSSVSRVRLFAAQWTVAHQAPQSMGSLRVGHDLSDFTFTFHFHALEKEMATHSSVLARVIRCLVG